MSSQRFFRLANTPWRMCLFLLWKLPAAWFMGIGVRHCDAEKCVVRLPYGWRSQNPFRSTYFAAQCAAAELSTGLLVMGNLQGKAPVSMLVTNIEAAFFKKAAATLLFTCEEGQRVKGLIEQALQTGEAQVFTLQSEGRLPDGQLAASVRITWSIKRKSTGAARPLEASV